MGIFSGVINVVRLEDARANLADISRRVLRGFSSAASGWRVSFLADFCRTTQVTGDTTRSTRGTAYRSRGATQGTRFTPQGTKGYHTGYYSTGY